MAVYPDNDNTDFSSDSSDDSFYYSPTNKQGSFRLNRYTRPLIGFVRKEWHTNTEFAHHSGFRRWVQMATSLISAPRFRRYVVLYFILLLSCVVGWVWLLSPPLAQHTSLRSLNLPSEDNTADWFGTNALPEIENIVRVGALDPSFLPRPADDLESRRRLIFIGDVHGCKFELDQLLEKASFNPSTDHLIFTGDLINRGPDSLGVVDLARKHSASCVRGNHEDQALILRHSMAEANTLHDISPQDSKDDKLLSKTAQAYDLARQLNDEQAQWLDTCPVILKVGQVPGMGEVVVVHGGLVPGVEVEKQDPVSVMNMRTIDLETHVPSSSRKGTKWTKLFNQDQALLYSRIKDTVPAATSEMTTVVYGHDAKSGLAIKPYTKGLDSNCVHGGKLTALVVDDSGKQDYVQVKCRDYQAIN